MKKDYNNEVSFDIADIEDIKAAIAAADAEKNAVDETARDFGEF